MEFRNCVNFETNFVNLSWTTRAWQQSSPSLGSRVKMLVNESRILGIEKGSMFLCLGNKINHLATL